MTLAVRTRRPILGVTVHGTDVDRRRLTTATGRPQRSKLGSLPRLWSRARDRERETVEDSSVGARRRLQLPASSSRGGHVTFHPRVACRRLGPPFRHRSGTRVSSWGRGPRRLDDTSVNTASRRNNPVRARLTSDGHAMSYHEGPVVERIIENNESAGARKRERGSLLSPGQ